MGKIPVILKLEKKYETDRLSLAAMMLAASCYLLLILFNFKGRLWSDMLLFYFPAYQSIKTIEKADLESYKHWLTYWLIFGHIELFENLSIMLKIFPYYFVLKSIIAIILMNGGSARIFDSVIKKWIPLMDQIAAKIVKITQ